MQIEFERGSELKREQRQIPAELYKTMHLRLSHHTQSHLFVPIRSMQYLAVIDAHEVVFVDGCRPRFVELAWCHFHPQQRSDLISPIGYDCVYYTVQSISIMLRLQNEFFKALEMLAGREKIPAYSQRRVLAFHPKKTR